MVLTVLLPDELSKGRTWLLVLIEGALLVALIVSGQVRLTRRASHIRILSIALVAVLVSYTLVVTWELIDDLIHGGKETNSASALLSAGSVVWVSNILAFSLLCWELDGGGSAARTHTWPRRRLDLAFPEDLNPHVAPANWLPRFIDLPLSRLYKCDRIQPNRRHADRPLGEGRNGGAGDRLNRHSRARDCPRRQRVHLELGGGDHRSPARAEAALAPLWELLPKPCA